MVEELDKNLAPKFKKRPSCPYLEIDFDNQVVYPLYKCELPQIEDPNHGDRVQKFELNLEKSTEKFMYFDE